MHVQSAFYSGLSGLRNASMQLNEASSKISRESTEKKSNSGALPSAQIDIARSQPSSLNNELLNLKTAEFQAKSSVNVIRTADEMLGTLIDTSV